MSEVTQMETDIASPFQVEIDQNRIAIVRINVTDNHTNWLADEVVSQLRSVIGSVLYQQARAVLFISGKADCFVKGFDLNALKTKNDSQLKALSQEAQAVMREINVLKVPVMAAIHGDCFGFGLELALACDYRLASDSLATQFALPQVRSGILPFAGGTQRLPRLIGLRHAVPLLLSGNKIGVARAKKLGLVDKVVPESALFNTAYQLLLDNQVQKFNHKSPLTLLKKWRKNLEANQYYRDRFLAHTENKVWLKTFGNYPAVTEILELLKEPHFKAGLEKEQQAFVSLFRTEQSQVLMSLKNTLRTMRDQYRDRSQVRDVLQVSVLGSGFMGAGIAYLTANNAQIPVRIKDIHPSEIQKALKHSYNLMKKEVEKKRLQTGEMIQRMNLISGGERLVAAQSTDFIIEAVYEDLELKRRMVRESENYYDEHAIFATNTSTFAIKDIASVAKRPENVIGFHYFSPVEKRQMVEIIPHSQTCEHTIATAIHFAIQQGKIPLLVADKQGFFINRILTPYLLEAIQCVLDGEAIEFIDRSLQEFGFHIGPLAMIDDIGLDVLFKSNPAMVRELGERFSLPDKVEWLITNERKGRKNRRGFYLYNSKGQRSGEDKSIYHVLETITRNDLESEQIARRCLLRMINEAAWCLQDGVIQSTDEGNVASVLGVTFPDFRGGIYAYIEKVGAKAIVSELRKHAQQYGARFTPCDWLIERANEE